MKFQVHEGSSNVSLFGQCLEYFRKEVYQMSYDEFAEICNIHRPQLINWCKGKTTARQDSIDKVAHSLSVPVMALLDMAEARKIGEARSEKLRQSEQDEEQRNKTAQSHLYAIRIWRDTTPAQLAELLCISPTTIVGWEKGTSKLRSIIPFVPALCKILNVKETVFFDEEAFKATVPLEYRIPNDEMKAIRAIIGARLRLLRQQHSWNLKDMTVKTGFNWTKLSAIERGTAPIPRHWIRIFADTLGTTVEALLTPNNSDVAVQFMQMAPAKLTRAARAQDRKKELGIDDDQLIQRNIDIGQCIVILREGRGLTDKEMAEELGMSRTTYRKVELGIYKNLLPMMPALVRILEVPMDVLFDKEKAMALVNSGTFLKREDAVLGDKLPGGRIFRLRMDKHLSRGDVAIGIGVIESQIKAWETGEQQLTRIEKMALAHYFNVPVNVIEFFDAFDAYINKEEK